MYNSQLKKCALVLNIILYLGAILIFLFQKSDSNSLSQFSSTNLFSFLIIVNNKFVTGNQCYLMTLVAPFSILISYIIRSIDWRNEHDEGGHAWILGIIIAFVSLYICVFTSEMIISFGQYSWYWVDIITGFVICLLTIYVPQHEKGYSEPESPFCNGSSTGCM